MRIKIYKEPLSIEQNNYLTKIVTFIFSMNYIIGQKILLTTSNLKIAYLEQLI